MNKTLIVQNFVERRALVVPGSQREARDLGSVRVDAGERRPGARGAQPGGRGVRCGGALQPARA